MIAADQFLLDGDTAWLVGTPHDLDSYELLPEPLPCIEEGSPFDIDVEVVEPLLAPGRRSLRQVWRTHRVSIVPGMVLPIVDNDAPEWYDRSDHHIGMGKDEYAEYDGRGPDEPKWLTDVSLPSAAAPGMWAVKLRVA